jgi:hypothetical protein
MAAADIENHPIGAGMGVDAIAFIGNLHPPIIASPPRVGSGEASAPRPDRLRFPDTSDGRGRKGVRPGRRSEGGAGRCKPQIRDERFVGAFRRLQCEFGHRSSLIFGSPTNAMMVSAYRPGVNPRPPAPRRAAKTAPAPA